MKIVEIANPLNLCRGSEERLRTAVERTLAAHGVQTAQISLAIVNNAQIHELNRRHLQHDYPTDVLSFLLDETDGTLEGEVIVSGEMAQEMAPQWGWSAEEELLLYAIHGTLHLVGFDDTSPEAAAKMRAAERAALLSLGVEPPARIDALAPAAAPEGGTA